jgi:hypothetical protein
VGQSPVIVLVTGPPGAGKSFYAVRKLGEAMEAGKFVGTNVELARDFAWTSAGSNPIRRLIPGRRAARARNLAARTWVADDLAELFRLRLPGRKEGRGVMVLDEASGWLNARNWSAKDRADVIRFFSQHRKLGWDVYLIVQDAEMLDKQVRALFEYHVHLRNLRRVKLLGLPILPVNLFLALWTWHGMPTRAVVKREVFRLSWHRKLYDTFEIVNDLAADGAADTITLPIAPELRAAIRRTGAGALATGVPAAGPLPDASPLPARGSRPPRRLAAGSFSAARSSTSTAADPAAALTQELPVVRQQANPSPTQPAVHGAPRTDAADAE